jgi:chitinase
MDLMWRNNISPSKITMGLGFYGRSFTLSDPSCTAPGCGFSAGGDPGQCTASAGTLSWAEIGDVIANNDPTITLDPVAGVKIVTWNGNRKYNPLPIVALLPRIVKIEKG